jgi:chromate transporter
VRDRSFPQTRVPLRKIAREWTRIGLTGFGGPPAHIALLRKLVVHREGWMDPRAFEDANAACSLLPGPASTQLSIFCAYRAGGMPGAIIGGLGFVLPAVILILALSVVFLAQAPPLWVRGAGAGAGAAVAAVALRAGFDLVEPSFARAREDGHEEARWALYLLLGALAAALVGRYLVLVLLSCGALELTLRRMSRATGGHSLFVPLLPVAAASGGLGALAWTSFKVGALSFGGGFVIIPLMQGDAVHVYHWMTNAEFLNAVALGQVTPGPVVATVAAVGYAASGIGAGLLAALVAFLPSFSFILLGGGRFERLRANRDARGFLDGAGPAAIGAIIGAAIPLAVALGEGWQFVVLVASAVGLLVLRRGVVEILLASALLGVAVVLAGAPIG